MTRTIRRAAALQGSLTLPGDKSISHRSLLLNALAVGEARVEGFLPSADCLSTMRCLRAYGVQFDYDYFRPLPFSSLVILAITWIYVVRAVGGVGIGGFLEDVQVREFVFSSVALAVAVLYGIGARALLRAQL